MTRGLLVAIGFLTRIPVPASAFEDGAARERSLAWYPLVGALIGGVLVALAWGLRDAAPLLRAALLLAAWIALTGAMHLDGLADSADAWVGGMGDRARTLAIMQDPASGPMGVTAIVAVLLLKFAALASASASAWPALLLASLLARAMLVALFLATPYVRPGGLGDALQRAPRTACGLALLASVIVVACCGLRGVVALAAALLVLALWRRACLARLGGCTGDTAGALVEMVEVAVLVASAFA
ncbi:MAG: adenosylcobinamide-GDP ribazoletransferase [Rhodanobacteraceae bacterium]|nr:MAG: adenosylcobinamide-GDP ribazoletransferase [Rhodanobacteraceae bacterium]